MNDDLATMTITELRALYVAESYLGTPEEELREILIYMARIIGIRETQWFVDYMVNQ